MYGIVCIGDETGEKTHRMASHPRILQRQEATNMPGVGKDKGRRRSYERPEDRAIGWEIEASRGSLLEAETPGEGLSDGGWSN